jgi:hypothetical protein
MLEETKIRQSYPENANPTPKNGGNRAIGIRKKAGTGIASDPR